MKLFRKYIERFTKCRKFLEFQLEVFRFLDFNITSSIKIHNNTSGEKNVNIFKCKYKQDGAMSELSSNKEEKRKIKNQ